MRIITDAAPQMTTGIPSAAVPEIGRIGLGKMVKTREGKPYPTATDYFVPRGEAQALFTERYGDQPRRLPICFFNDQDEASCSVRLEIRDRTGDLYSYSDGETYYFRPKNGGSGYTHVVSRAKTPDIAGLTEAFLRQGLTAEKAKAIEWKPTLYLRFMIRDFPVTGYWQIMTHGASSTIPQVTRMVDTWKQLIGSLSLVPFLLVIKRGKSRDTSKQFTYLNLLPDFSIEQALQFAQNRSSGQAALTQMNLLNPLRIEQPDLVYEPTVVVTPALPTGTN